MRIRSVRHKGLKKFIQTGDTSRNPERGRGKTCSYFDRVDLRSVASSQKISSDS